MESRDAETTIFAEGKTTLRTWEPSAVSVRLTKTAMAWKATHIVFVAAQGGRQPELGHSCCRGVAGIGGASSSGDVQGAY